MLKKKATIQQIEDYSLEKEIGRLRVTAFPYHPEVHDFDFYTSVYRWYEQHPLADEVYRWAAITPEGEVVGFLSTFPQYYRINGRRVIAQTPTDYMVHPDYGFYALSLMRKFFRTCENCVACDMVPATIKVEERLGAEVAGQLHYAAKVLSASRIPMPPLPARLRRLLNLPDPATPAAQGYPGQQTGGTTDSPAGDGQEPEVLPPRPRLPLPAPAKRLLNAGFQGVDEALGRAFGGSFEVEVVEEFDDAFDALFERVAAAVPCIPEKDAAFLRWRYGPDSPQHPVKTLAVRENGELLGYTVLVVTFDGIDGYILDLTTLPERGDVARALLRAAVRFFREEGAQIVRYRFRESAVSARTGDLRRMGFFYRNTRLNSLLAKFGDPGLHAVARHASNWAYSIGDGEPTFWMRQELPDWIERPNHDD